MLKKLKDSSIYYHNVKDIANIQEIDEYTIKIVTAADMEYFEYNLISPNSYKLFYGLDTWYREYQKIQI